MSGPEGWDIKRIALALLLLTHVWRLPDLAPALGVFKPMFLATGLALGCELLVPGGGGRLARGVRHPVVRWAILLLALGAASVPGSLYPGLSFDFLMKNQLDAFLVLLLVVLGTRGAADVERFAAVHVAGAALYTAVILARYDVGADGRLGSLVYYDANDLGMLLVSTIPLACYFAWRSRSLLWRGGAVTALGILLLGIIRTGSRGAFLGLVAVSTYVLFREHRIAVRWRVGVAAAATLLLVALAPGSYWRAMGTVLRPTEDYNWVGAESGGRMEVWRRGIGYMLERPVLGVGVGAFEVAEGTISPIARRQAYGRGTKWSAAHNSFVQVGAELGVLGLVGFIAMLWTAYRSAGGDRFGIGRLIVAALGGYLVTGAFLSQAYAPFLYALLALAVGIAVAPVPPPSPRAPVRPSARDRPAFATAPF